MQGGNRFLDFANEIMARHRGLGFGFEPAAMLYLEDTEKYPEEQAVARQNLTTNLYHIQNVREENYLFKQNLSFLTQILENKMYQNLYPAVEKQIETVIHEEMPQAEAKVIQTVSRQLLKLVQQGGIEQFQIVREKVLSQYREAQKTTEKTTLKEQERLFRKIENIWNSSVYRQTVQQKNQTVVAQNNNTLLVDNTWNIQQGHNLSVQQRRLEQQTTIQNYPIQQTEIVHPEIQKTEIVHSQSIQPEIRTTETKHSEVFRAEKGDTTIQQLDRAVTGISQEVSPTVERILSQTVKENAVRERKTEKEIHDIYRHEIKETDRMSENVLDRTLRAVEVQNQTITNVLSQKVGNLGKIYERFTEAIVPAVMSEKILESHTRELDSKTAEIRTQIMTQVPLEYVEEQSVPTTREILQLVREADGQNPEVSQKESQKEIYRENRRDIYRDIHRDIYGDTDQANLTQVSSDIQNLNLSQKTVSSGQAVTIHQETLHLEYPSEETIQFHQEILELLHSEIQRAPEIPQVVERTKTLSQQILSRMDSIIRMPVSQMNTIENTREQLVTNTVTKTVTKTVALNRLSHAIMEYAESRTTSEELQTHMLQILEDYRTDMISVPGTDRNHVIYNNRGEIVTKETLNNKNSQRLIRTMINQGNAATAALLTNVEPAPIVYRSEESESPEQNEKTKQLEKQVHEVVKTIKQVEEKTVVQKEQFIEEQRKVVREVLNETPTIWTEGKGAGVIRNEVQQSVEEQMNASVNQIANRVYRRLEEKLKSERGRRGLI